MSSFFSDKDVNLKVVKYSKGSRKKMSQIVEKVQNFLDPLLGQLSTILNLGRN